MSEFCLRTIQSGSKKTHADFGGKNFWLGKKLTRFQISDFICA